MNTKHQPHAAAFRLEQVSVCYRSGAAAALSGLSLTIAPGEAVALVGPSGAGKSTLIRLLNGSVRASEGTVHVDGVALGECSPRQLRALRAGIALVPQELALVPNLRAISNVLCGRFGRQSSLRALRSVLWPSLDEKREAHALLERVGIGEKLFERVDQLSGGQRQRVAIARALYQAPHALLADEPVSSVDPARARDTIQLLVELSRERGLTLVASLHDLELARSFFPRLVGLRAGRVEFDDASSEFRDDEFKRLYELGSAAHAELP